MDAQVTTAACSILRHSLAAERSVDRCCLGRDDVVGNCAEAVGINGRFTVHGMRRTFNDLARRGGVDAVVTKSITGHVTEEMREHYSSVALDEKRKAITAVYGLVQTSPGGGEVGDRVGDDGSGRLAS